MDNMKAWAFYIIQNKKRKEYSNKSILNIITKTDTKLNKDYAQIRKKHFAPRKQKKRTKKTIYKRHFKCWM